MKLYTIKRIYDWLETHFNKERYLLIYGSSGAGKSYTVAQFIVINFLLNGLYTRTLVVRKTYPSLHNSVYYLIKNILSVLNIDYIENKQEHSIKFLNNELLFKSIDNPEKIKSAEFNYIWLEEATEFTIEDFNFLDMVLRRYNSLGSNQMFLTFNPIKASWVYEHFWERGFKDNENVAILNVNYKVNPFLNEQSKIMLENLKQQNEAMWRIYAKGEFAEPENIIYQNWEVVDNLPDSFDEIIYGGDFGFKSPTAVLKIGIKDNDLYIIDEIYATEMTNKDLIEALEDFYTDKQSPSYWDSEEPGRIEELYRAGFNAHPSDKSNVIEGINKVQEFKIYIHKRCTNTIKEIRTYSWQVDKNGKIIEKPVKFMDHTMDALRYAVYTHFSKMQRGVNIWAL